jgi:hypothetical protein
MQKQNNICILTFLVGIVLLYALCVPVFAAGSATVSWTPPTTDEGGGTLTGLAGYRVYYDTSSHWADTCPLDAGTYVDVPDGAATSKLINNILTAGQTYYFTVVAYDEESTPNISGCATGTGGVTEVSKQISYSGDVNPTKDCTVDNLDYTVLHAYYGTSNNTADINKDGTVDNLDYAYIHSDYNHSFTPCNQ